MGEKARQSASLAPAVSPELPNPAGDASRQARYGNAHLQEQLRLNPGGAKPALDRAVSSASSPLPYRRSLEAAFGQDLGTVRAHLGGADVEAALGQIGAGAAALGEDILFADANPDQRSVAHEVAHVVQSRLAPAPAGTASSPGDRAETEADAAADAVMRGEAPDVEAGATGDVQGGWLGNLVGAVSSAFSGAPAAAASTTPAVAAPVVATPVPTAPVPAATAPAVSASVAPATSGATQATPQVLPAATGTETSGSTAAATSALAVLDQGTDEDGAADPSVFAQVGGFFISFGENFLEGGEQMLAGAEQVLPIAEQVLPLTEQVLPLAIDLAKATFNTGRQAGESASNTIEVAQIATENTLAASWNGVCGTVGAMWDCVTETSSALVDEQGTLGALCEGWADIRNTAAEADGLFGLFEVAQATVTAATGTLDAVIDERSTLNAFGEGLEDIQQEAHEGVLETTQTAETGLLAVEASGADGLVEVLDEAKWQLMSVGGSRASELSENFPSIGLALGETMEWLDEKVNVLNTEEQRSDAEETSRTETITQDVPGATFTLIYVSGQETSADALDVTVEGIAEETGFNVVAPPNPTYGASSDTAQSLELMAYGANDPQVLATAELIFDAVMSGQPCPIVAHSQGALITADALEVVYGELVANAPDKAHAGEWAEAQMVDSIQIVTFGGAAGEDDFPAFLTDAGCLDTVVNANDPVPVLSGAEPLQMGAQFDIDAHAIGGIDGDGNIIPGYIYDPALDDFVQEVKADNPREFTGEPSTLA